MTTADLMALLSSLTDEELAHRVASGGLPEEGHARAAAELRSRGLDAPDVTSDEETSDQEYLGDMVMIERGLTPTEAHILCSVLRAAGIQAAAGDTNLVQTHSLLEIAVGGAKIRVPSAQVAESKEVVAAFRRGDFELDDDFNPDETVA